MVAHPACRESEPQRQLPRGRRTRHDDPHRGHPTEQADRLAIRALIDVDWIETKRTLGKRLRLRNGRIQLFDCYPSGTVILGQLGVLADLGAVLEQQKVRDIA